MKRSDLNWTPMQHVEESWRLTEVGTEMALAKARFHLALADVKIKNWEPMVSRKEVSNEGSSGCRMVRQRQPRDIDSGSR